MSSFDNTYMIFSAPFLWNLKTVMYLSRECDYSCSDSIEASFTPQPVLILVLMLRMRASETKVGITAVEVDLCSGNPPKAGYDGELALKVDLESAFLHR